MGVTASYQRPYVALRIDREQFAAFTNLADFGDTNAALLRERMQLWQALVRHGETQFVIVAAMQRKFVRIRMRAQSVGQRQARGFDTRANVAAFENMAEVGG